jgi:hypothetical protein
MVIARATNITNPIIANGIIARPIITRNISNSIYLPHLVNTKFSIIFSRCSFDSKKISISLDGSQLKIFLKQPPAIHILISVTKKYFKKLSDGKFSIVSCRKVI